MIVGAGFIQFTCPVSMEMLSESYMESHLLICFFVGMEGGQVQPRRDLNRANSGGRSQAHTFTYQSSSVTYGGINGAYYTASKTRRTGSNGVS